MTSSTKSRSSFRCTECSATAPKWVGRCSSCGSWGSMVEEVAPAARRGTSLARLGAAAALGSAPATPLTQIDAHATHAKPTGVGELDRVLGGGVVPGSVVLLAGEPGVGKSTLLLEVVHRWAQRGPQERALYVTGEESAGQVRLRADRTGAVHERVYLAADTDLGSAVAQIEAVQPTLVVVDSVQTLLAADVDGAAGGVTQVKAVTSALTSLAKASGIPVLLVGHVTKEGTVAGPRSLEHLVDVVLQFEGDRHSSLRMVRGVKNRFGSADEVGCFELREDGIVEVPDPSGLFLGNHQDPVAGTAVAVVLDGKRPLLGEVQALVTAPSGGVSPRRTVSGLDAGRVAMMLAVADRRSRIPLLAKDIYAATVGGMRVGEPAGDLAVALALASAACDQPLPARMVFIGEVGLGGEIRRVPNVSKRLAEAARLGFDRAIVPEGKHTVPAGMTAYGAPDLSAALHAAGLRWG